MFRSIQSDKDTAVEAAERIEDAFGFDGLKEQRIERLGGDAVEHLANMGIGGDFVYSKQGSLLQNPACALNFSAFPKGIGRRPHPVRVC